jgi:acyl-CoA reductase-like NAD-dependent aldehyde dehydrogenase
VATTAAVPLLELHSDSGETFPVADPATGETIAEVPRMGTAETRRAIERAKAALPAWRSTLARDRARILRRWADLMLEHDEQLARLLTTEQGKPLAEARTEIAYAAAFFEWFGEEAKRVYGDTIPTYTRDAGRIWRLSEALEYGIHGINTGLISTEVAPFGGSRSPGSAVRDRSTGSRSGSRSSTSVRVASR